MKFYGKSGTLVNENRSVTFVFCKDVAKKEKLQGKTVLNFIKPFS